MNSHQMFFINGAVSGMSGILTIWLLFLPVAIWLNDVATHISILLNALSVLIAVVWGVSLTMVWVFRDKR